MLKITDENYNDYKQIFNILWRFNAHLINLDPNSEDSPIILLAKWEEENKSLAKKGLKSGLIDVITMSMSLSIDRKIDINEQLISNGFSGFNQLVSIIKETLRRVLKRGKIKNVDEYYILKELLDDSASIISDAEKENIEVILRNFEIGHSL